jgi:hypothetical protein
VKKIPIGCRTVTVCAAVPAADGWGVVVRAAQCVKEHLTKRCPW